MPGQVEPSHEPIFVYFHAEALAIQEGSAQQPFRGQSLRRSHEVSKTGIEAYSPQVSGIALK